MKENTKQRFRKIYIQITNCCNLNCSFCGTSESKPLFMSEKQFKAILEQIAGYSSHLYLHVKGEPLLHPRLDFFLDLCQQHDFKVVLVTNGMLLKKKGEELLRHPALKQVNISLHCYHEIQNVQARANYLDSLFKFLQGADKSHVTFSLRLWNMMADQTEVWQENNKLILAAIEQSFSTTIQLPNKPSVRDGFQIRERIWLNFDYRFQWPSLSQPEITTVGTCLGLRDHIAILTDGTVIPCCIDSEGIINLGNIFHTSFDEILQSSRAQVIIEGFRRSRRVEPLCCRCKFYQ